MRINYLADIDGYLSQLSRIDGLCHFQQKLTELEQTFVPSIDSDIHLASLKSLFTQAMEPSSVDQVMQQMLALPDSHIRYLELCLIEVLMSNSANDSAMQLLLALYQHCNNQEQVNQRLCALADALVSLDCASLKNCHTALSLLMFVESVQTLQLQQKVCSLIDVALAQHGDDKPLQTLVTIIRTLVLPDALVADASTAAAPTVPQVAQPVIQPDDGLLVLGQVLAVAVKPGRKLSE